MEVAESAVWHQKRQAVRNNGLIWHYTTMPVLEHFLRGEIAFTHFQFLNDSKDLSYGLDLLQRIARETGNEFLSAAVLENEYADIFSMADSYLFCLSRAADSLYQWRSYAQRGGVAIGFWRVELYNAVFDSLADDARFDDKIDLFSLLKCRYVDESARRLVIRLTNRIENEKTDSPRDIREMLKCECGSHSLFVALVLKVLLAQKNPSFEEEQEERLLVSGRLRQNVEVLGEKPRIVLRSPAVATSIGEIRLSPHGDTVRNRFLVELLRDKYGLKFEVSDSMSSYNGM